MPFVDNFAPFFHTLSNHDLSEIRAYILGMLQAKRGAKNMERMEEHVKDFHYQRVQNKLSHSPWDHRPLMDEIARQADGLLGGGGRTRLVIDDTGIAKKGTHSVGVARQYSGRAGKIDNCQIAVCASLASGQRSTLVDTRLFLPEEWTSNKQRCINSGVPENEIVEKSKAQIALESVKHLRELGVRFDVVSFDSGYGSQTPLLHSLDDCGEVFVAEVHCDQHVWIENPWPHWEGKRPGTKLSKARATHPSQRVDQWIQNQSDTAWKRLKIRDSDQGWVEVSYLAERIWLIEGDRVKLWWLLAWENPDEKCGPDKHGVRTGPRRHYALSNAGADADERRLVADGVERNVVERNFHDAKSEVGMADYQLRGWLGWHHHMALVMLSMLFLTRERMHWSSPAASPSITCGDIVFVLERMLPQRAYGPPDPLEIEKMLTTRLRKRHEDQRRRQQKTRQNRPPLLPDEIAPETTK